MYQVCKKDLQKESLNSIKNCRFKAEELRSHSLSSSYSPTSVSSHFIPSSNSTIFSNLSSSLTSTILSNYSYLTFAISCFSSILFLFSSHTSTYHHYSSWQNSYLAQFFLTFSYHFLHLLHIPIHHLTHYTYMCFIPFLLIILLCEGISLAKHAFCFDTERCRSTITNLLSLSPYDWQRLSQCEPYYQLLKSMGKNKENFNQEKIHHLQNVSSCISFLSKAIDI